MSGDLSYEDWQQVANNLFAARRQPQKVSVPVTERRPSRLMCWIGLWHPLLLLARCRNGPALSDELMWLSPDR